MEYREFRIQPTSRAGTVALAAGVIVVGGTLVVLGATILLTLGVVGATVGTGAALYRRLTRRSTRGAPQMPRRTTHGGLDPRLEVFAADATRVDGLLPPPPSRD